jgi:hypothetical protein
MQNAMPARSSGSSSLRDDRALLVLVVGAIAALFVAGWLAVRPPQQEWLAGAVKPETVADYSRDAVGIKIAPLSMAIATAVRGDQALFRPPEAGRPLPDTANAVWLPPTQTPTHTATATNTSTRTATRTRTRTPTKTATTVPTKTHTPTNTPTNTPTLTPTLKPTDTPVPPPPVTTYIVIDIKPPTMPPKGVIIIPMPRGREIPPATRPPVPEPTTPPAPRATVARREPPPAATPEPTARKKRK